MKRFLVAVKILLCATLCSTFVSAQSSGWDGVRQLSSGSQAKIVLRNGRSYNGHIRSVDDNGILLESGQSVTKQDIKRVLTKTRGHRGKHALIGGAIGAATGLGVGAALDANCSSFCLHEGVAILTPAFALIGLGVGALLPAHGWQEVYRSH